MSLAIRIILAVSSVIFLIYVLKLVAKGKLLLKYSLLWLVLGIILLLCAVFPGIVLSLSGLIGFVSPSNLVFLAAIGILLAVSLSLSVIASRQVIAIKNLTQRLALLESENESPKTS